MLHPALHQKFSDAPISGTAVYMVELRLDLENSCPYDSQASENSSTCIAVLSPEVTFGSCHRR